MSRNKYCFPNLYCILVAAPGVGKSIVMQEVYGLWAKLEQQYISPSSVTAASVIDALNAAKRTVLRIGQVPPHEEYHCLKVLASELGSLLPQYDNEMMNYLTDIYDNQPFRQTRRGSALDIKLPKPQISILGGTTPGFLGNLMPTGAWDQGFTSRTLFIYSGQGEYVDPFDTPPLNESLHADLIHDIQLIGHDELYGEIKIDEDAKELLRAASRAGIPPAPEHPKLQHYLPRRFIMLLKLCMVSSASRGRDYRITVQDYQNALDWLLEAEFAMPDIFRAMVGGGDSRAIEDAWYYCWQIWTREKKPVREARLFSFLSEKVPSHNVQKVIDVMHKSGVLKEAMDEVTGGKAYLPEPRMGILNK